MAKDYKSTIIVALILIISFVVGFNYYNRNKVFNEIKDYVTENESSLEKLTEDAIDGKEVKLPKEIKSISVHSSKKDYVKNNNTIVEFLYKESKTKKQGFYYSVNDEPAAYNNKDYPMLEMGGEKWSWSDDNSKAEGLTRIIKNNWYYFSATLE